MKQDNIRALYCCICGGCTRGRQWFNRDTGYGLCAPCANKYEPRESAESFKSCYGVRGVHFDVVQS